MYAQKGHSSFVARYTLEKCSQIYNRRETTHKFLLPFEPTSIRTKVAPF